MHIATVIPIARGIPFDALTYYASAPLPVGTLVAVPLGRQTIYGFVIETTSLADAKSFVKKAAFSLKKIKSVLSHQRHFEAVTAALKETGMLALAPIGAVAASVVPNVLFEYLSAEKFLPDPIPASAGAFKQFEETAVLGSRAERLDSYKRLVRSSFAEKKSVLFVAPTIRALEWWKKELERGIARHAVIFHSKINKKTMRSNFTALKQAQMPLLIFATPGFSALPAAALGTIIAEDESSNLYRSNDRFEIDTRIFLKHLAAALSLSLVWGDTLPRLETLHRTDATHLPRTFVPDKLHIVPIEPYRTILPSEVVELLRHTEKKKRRLFIYTNRKGVAPLSRCADCGTIVQCPSCELPMALRNRIVSGERARFFVCLHCAATLPSEHVCAHCGGWNIVPVAIGTESIRDAVMQVVGSDSVFVIDDTLTPDSKEIASLLEAAEKQKYAIIIGTQKALPYIKKINYAVIPFFDRLLSTPSLYTTEQIIRLLMECNEAVSDAVVVCTKTPQFPMIASLETQKINAILTEELDLRRQLGYPPFGMLLKISMTVPEGYRQEIAEEMNGYFSDEESTALPARRISAGSMKVLLVWLVKVSNDYIEENGQGMLEFLDSLRFPYKVEQNPERL